MTSVPRTPIMPSPNSPGETSSTTSSQPSVTSFIPSSFFLYSTLSPLFLASFLLFLYLLRLIMLQRRWASYAKWSSSSSDLRAAWQRVSSHFLVFSFLCFPFLVIILFVIIIFLCYGCFSFRIFDFIRHKEVCEKCRKEYYRQFRPLYIFRPSFFLPSSPSPLLLLSLLSPSSLLLSLPSSPFFNMNTGITETLFFITQEGIVIFVEESCVIRVWDSRNPFPTQVYKEEEGEEGRGRGGG